MSKKEPTDRQLVMWWMHEAVSVNPLNLRPTWVAVQCAISAAFKVEIREKRAKRLRSLIHDEVDNLLAIYERKARVLL